MKRDDLRCDCNIVHEAAARKAREAMMPPESVIRVSAAFKVLGDPTRVKLVWALKTCELCVCDLAAVLNMTESAISHQLRTLKQAKIVKSRREGKNVFYSLDDRHVTGIIELALAHAEH